MAAVATASSAQVIYLFKLLFREANKFSNYNVREYVKGRVKEEFRKNVLVTDPIVVATAYTHGQNPLQVAKRQSVVYSLYAPRVKSLMDLKITDHS